jgi:imidazolonepropionase
VSAELLVTGISQLAGVRAAGPHGGVAQGAVEVIADAALALTGDRIAWLGPVSRWRGGEARRVDLGGRAVVPGLVDPHTHLLWAGDRLDDFEARSRGDSYGAILERGGGIRSTVRATAAAARETLVESALTRAAALLRSGATTIEVKSGYGGSIEGEVRSLEAIAALAERTPARIVATLLVHLPPATGRAAYVDEVVGRLLPEVARRRLATRADVFVEREAFTVEEARVILGAALALGLDATLHADQFTVLGGVELAVSLGARSVDHLEASGSEQIAALAASGTLATLLPGASLELGGGHAPGRALVDAGAAVAVGSDLNPGSSPLYSTSLALALAVRLNGLLPAEALVAGTANAAAALGLADVGRLAPGCRADFVVLSGADWRELVAGLGGPGPFEVWLAGRRLAPAGEA